MKARQVTWGFLAYGTLLAGSALIDVPLLGLAAVPLLVIFVVAAHAWVRSLTPLAGTSPRASAQLVLAVSVLALGAAGAGIGSGLAARLATLQRAHVPRPRQVVEAWISLDAATTGWLVVWFIAVTATVWAVWSWAGRRHGLGVGISLVVLPPLLPLVLLASAVPLSA